LDYPAHRRWLLLSDVHSPKLFWLQSLDEAELAVPVVSSLDTGIVEFRFVQEALEQLAELNDDEDTHPVALLALQQTEQSVYLDQDRPILVNPTRRVGRQFACRPAESSQTAPSLESVPLRKVA
jgi:hypothetical protein